MVWIVRFDANTAEKIHARSLGLSKATAAQSGASQFVILLQPPEARYARQARPIRSNSSTTNAGGSSSSTGSEDDDPEENPWRATLLKGWSFHTAIFLF